MSNPIQKKEVNPLVSEKRDLLRDKLKTLMSPNSVKILYF